jgi:hypothetical protein
MLQIGAIYGVVRFYNMLRAGISWKGPEAIELWCQKDRRNEISDSDVSYDDDDDDDTALLTNDSTSGSDVAVGDSV